MNAQHLAAFLWLTWRLRVNQIKRGGIANQVLLVILALNLALAAVGLFVGAFFLAFLFQDAPAVTQLIVWDVVVVAFLAWWSVGLMSDLARSESLALTKFLHLPVSLSGVFVLNYLASLVSINLILFVPAMVGYSLGMAVADGPALLLLLPLAASFVLMVTALSYQFQGWLASLMVNKRRRRTVIFIATLVLVLIFQLPNLINILRPWESDRAEGAKAARRARSQLDWKQAEETVWYVNAAVPVGWLPMGAMKLVEGSVLPALAGTLGMGLIGGASLWRAYRTTVRLYTGQYTAGATPASAPTVPMESVKPAAGLIALYIPLLSEQASGIALASFRALTRAPEARMLLLSPIFMMVIFGGVFWRGSMDLPDHARPLPAVGAIAMVLLSLMQIVGNQFGFDRSGFRVYVLSPAPRRDILLGKNLAVLPVALVLACPLIIFVQVFAPMRIDHLIALMPQFVSMYLLYCLVANMLSIYAPLAIASGSMKPATTKLLPTLMHMVFAFVMPMALAPTLLPLAIEFALEMLEWIEGAPIYLLLALAECAAVVWLYRWVLRWQGELLQAREQTILEVVVTKAE